MRIPVLRGLEGDRESGLDHPAQTHPETCAWCEPKPGCPSGPDSKDPLTHAFPHFILVVLLFKLQ